jgi:hypothetical protein
LFTRTSGLCAGCREVDSLAAKEERSRAKMVEIPLRNGLAQRAA